MRNPKNWLIALLALAFVGYIFFQARALLFGPQVWIESPANGALVDEDIVTILGGSKNIAWIEFNGRQIFTNENGRWKETLLVSDGTSIITVKVRDRFGRQNEENVLIYK